MKLDEIAGLTFGEARNNAKTNFSPRFQFAVDIAIIVFPVIFVYINAFSGSFQFDDYNVIVFNPVVHSWSAWWEDIGQGIRPFLKFTYTMNWASDMGLFGFHLFNIVIHLLNVVLVYAIILKFLENKQQYALYSKRGIAILTALFFGLHPIQTEAVTYISARSASLMSTFYFGSMLSYVYGRIENRRFFLYVLSPILFVFGVATKEVAVTLPLALILWELTDRRQPFSVYVIIRRQAVHWLLLIPMIFFIITHSRYAKLLVFSFELRGFYANLLSQINGVMYLLSRLFLLTDLNIDPDLPVIVKWSLPVILETGLLSLLLFAGIISIFRMPWLSFCILWFFLQVMFINTIVPRNDIINERHFYIGGLGVFFFITMVSGMFFNICERYKKTLLIFGLCVYLMLGYFTIMRNHVYRSEIALWEDTARKSPKKARVFNNLGYAYYLEGQYDKAKGSYVKALQIEPGFELARNNLLLLEKAH